MSRRSFTLTGDLVGSDLQRFLEVLSAFATSALLVVRRDLGLSEQGENALSLLAPFLVRNWLSSAWPGTELLGEEAELREYHYEFACRAVLLELSTSLFSWQQPDSPEDLCLLRDDSSTVLGTIAHEHDAFLELSDDELQMLTEAMPELDGRLTES